MRIGGRLAVAGFLVTTLVRAAIVDRVEIAVGNRVITRSDIELRIRLTAFQNREAPDFGVAARRDAARRLVDQKIIEREMEIGHYPRIGALPVDGLLAAFEQQNYPAEDKAASHTSMIAALAKYGLSEAELRLDLARQADLLTFLSLRFRPSIDVSDAEVKKYFDERVVEAAKQQLGLGGMRSQIEEAITGERADKDMESWLDDQRRRTRIDYPDPELAGVAK